MSSGGAPHSAGAVGSLPAHVLMIAPVVVFYLLFLVGPYFALLLLSLYKFSSSALYTTTITLDNYLSVLGDGFYMRMLGGTILLGIGVTVVTLVLGYPLAMAIVRAGPRMKAFLLIVALSPLLVNLIVRTYAWLVLLGDKGIINAWLMTIGLIAAPLPINNNYVAVTLGLVHVTLPLMIISLVGIMERIDPSLLEAAESLGAGPWRILSRVHFHLALPGVGTGSLLVFCSAISAFVTPRLLGGNRVSTISTVVYEKFMFSMNWPLGATLVFLLLALNFAVIMLHGRLFREN
ncbi:MAG: ABC transporter permease [Alphaproteobacteria bacterium]|nr:ABC transporter permease [Alphaproteobacteria bacterium]